jgi:hypothetical protein
MKDSVQQKLGWVKSNANRWVLVQTVALGIISLSKFTAILYLPYFLF